MKVSLQFPVSDVADRIDDGYVELIIQRDDGGGGGLVEISHATTRPPLRDVVERYVYQDTVGDEAWDYQAIPVKADGAEYPTPTAADVVESMAYTTLQAIRDEGVLAADVSDERVEETIELASQYIEDYTQSWFQPRFQKFELSGEDRPRFFFDIPVIALQKLTVNDEDDNIGNIEVNNRYLRNGLTSPDDRKNPMMTYADGYLIEPGERLYTLGGGYFPHDRQETRVWGIFGYTELPRGAVCGETSTKSQVPLNYGTVPKLIEWCARMIVINHVYPLLSDDSLELILKNRMTRLKTRDQEVEFSDQDSSEVTTTTGFTNSTAIDEVLSRFKRPMKMLAV